MEILDEDATKPEGWLDDEPEEIEDPDADEPEDWDEEKTANGGDGQPGAESAGWVSGSSR